MFGEDPQPLGVSQCHCRQYSNLHLFNSGDLHSIRAIKSSILIFNFKAEIELNSTMAENPSQLSNLACCIEKLPCFDGASDSLEERRSIQKRKKT
jgi:hypothetical protein